MLSLSTLMKEFNAFSCDSVPGQRRSGEEKNRRRTSSATGPAVWHRGASVPALRPPTANPTQHTDVGSTCFSAEPSELQLQHSSNDPARRHGTGGPLCPTLDRTSFSSGSKRGRHPAWVGGDGDWQTPTAAAHRRRCASSTIYHKMHPQPLYENKMTCRWRCFFLTWTFSCCLTAGHMGDRLPGSSVLPEAQPLQSGISYSSPPSQHLQPQVSCQQTKSDQTQQQQLSVVSHL